MAISKPAGNPANHRGIGVRNMKDRAAKKYGQSRAGFGLTKGGMDDIPTRKREQTNQGRKSASTRIVIPGFVLDN